MFQVLVPSWMAGAGMGEFLGTVTVVAVSELIVAQNLLGNIPARIIPFTSGIVVTQSSTANG